MSDDRQPELIPSHPPLTSAASLQAALGAFEQHMDDEGFAENTKKAFLSDVRLLGKYLGIGQPVGEIGTQNLNDFLYWLRFDRGVPCSPKSYSRRVTTLKVFFGWLHEAGVLYHDPSAAVIQASVSSPLPDVPTEAELQKGLEVTERLRQGDGGNRPDARPHLLLTLLLDTGIKKGEVMSIVPNHIDQSDPDNPFLFVRYRDPSKRYKERKIALKPQWLEVLDEYLEQYEPADTLFTCTARNLEYILSDVAEAAGLDKSLFSFENLRWASAMHDYKDGTEPDRIRQRLGLSKVTWRETKSKLEKLVKRDQERAAQPEL